MTKFYHIYSNSNIVNNYTDLLLLLGLSNLINKKENSFKLCKRVDKVEQN